MQFEKVGKRRHYEWDFGHVCKTAKLAVGFDMSVPMEQLGFH